ncbi:MAG: DEAD/DEAH box helicase [bacterium]|nr:DEAD/DEAH box helicase [bacterium]
MKLYNIMIQKNIQDNVSKETFRTATRLLNDEAILACYTEGKNNYFIVKKAKDQIIKTNILEINNKIKNKKYSELSSEDLASYLHYQLYRDKLINNSKSREITQKNAPPKKINSTYAAPSEPPGKLYLYSKTGFPDASSAWEHCDLNVKLKINKQEYIGNINKLRQIRFDEDKAVSTLKISNFDSQSRQIIRFLSQHAEADGSGFSLKSDMMSELFHSLIGFQNFFFNDEQIIIHRECAEIVTVTSRNDKNLKTPNLLINNNLLPIKNTSLIFGKTGIWIGVKGEYWWIPAIVDLIWLRKFLLSEKPVNKNAPLPLRHIDSTNYELEKKSLISDFLIELNDKNALKIKPAFNYDGNIISSSNNRLSVSNHKFWERDKRAERDIINELCCFGFKEESSNNNIPSYFINDIESIGIFADKILPSWETKTNIDLRFTTNAGKLLLSGISNLNLICTNPVENGTQVQLKYIIEPEENKIYLKDLIKYINKNRTFIITQNNTLLKIPHYLYLFIKKFQNVISVNARSKNTFKIPIGSILYWIKSAEDAPGLIPKQWKNLSSKLTNDSELKIDKNKIDTQPIATQFKGILRNYQKESVAWMNTMISEKFNIILADEMGLGKTIQALALINNLKFKSKHSIKCIVVCPTSLTDNWFAEAAKFTPDLKTLLINGSNRKSLFEKIPDYELIITSYALIKRDVDEYNKLNFDLLILDEAQHIKNPATINSKVCKSIDSKHRIVLTGTPLENSPEDIWSIFDFLNPGMLGTKDSFKSNYSKIEDDIDKQKELAQRIAPFILRRHKKDVEQLPDKIEQTLLCEMSPKQQKLYDKILYEGQLKCKSFFKGKLSRFDVLTSLLRLRQLCCHPLLLPEIINHELEDSTKTDLLQEVIFETIDSGHRPLIFSQFTSFLSIIRKWCDDQNISYEYLDGQTKNRLEKVNRFNKNKDINLFLLSLKAGGTGLNLTGADTVIIYDPWWNPSVEAQATDRTHRIGQEKQVTTIKLVVKNSIEEKILNLQQRKQNLFNGIVEHSSSFRKLTDQDINYLLY